VELRDVAARVGTDPMRAAAALASGLLAEARHDHESARACLEDAADFFDRHGAPFESARARMALGRSLAALERMDAAVREVNAALEAFRRMGAAKEAEAAERLLRALDPVAAHLNSARDESGLTAREIEVLRLIAAGRSNQEIADELVLSIRTVERHISTIYEKLGATGKAARAAATTYAHRHGMG
jgi:DNA-binding NarL/FixJ family response regulator